MQLAKAFFECIIRLSHFSKGCQQGCVEEAYTHSFATGMVEFAQRNPMAWFWFNWLLTQHHHADVRFDEVVRGIVARAPPVPKRIVVAGRPVTIRSIGKSECGNAFGWYDWDLCEAQLYDGLKGHNLAIVALHELTHAVHHLYEIRERSRHPAFRTCAAERVAGHHHAQPERLAVVSVGDDVSYPGMPRPCAQFTLRVVACTASGPRGMEMPESCDWQRSSSGPTRGGRDDRWEHPRCGHAPGPGLERLLR